MLFLVFHPILRILLYGIFECVNLDLGKSKGELREFYVKREKKRERELRRRRRIRPREEKEKFYVIEL